MTSPILPLADFGLTMTVAADPASATARTISGEIAADAVLSTTDMLAVCGLAATRPSVQRLATIPLASEVSRATVNVPPPSLTANATTTPDTACPLASTAMTVIGKASSAATAPV